MGLLKTADSISRKDYSGDLHSEIKAVRDELNRVRRHNDSLLNQVNNLISIVQEQNRRKRNLQQRISVNPKTGLPNHNQMDQDFQDYFGRNITESDPRTGAVVLVKLDANYDIICKTVKQSVSEWIIYQTGVRLKESVTDHVPVYHTRDDEFILRIEDRSTLESLGPLIQGILEQVSKPHVFSGFHIVINCQIGISLYPDNGVAKGTLLNNADIALNNARKNNRRWVIFNDSMRQEVVQKMELQNSIIKALEQQSIREIDKQFFIHLQPIVTVSGISSGEPVIERIDAEALIRWRHPERGTIAPDSFIPVAEETGLIVIIGKWVLYTATAQIESWLANDGIDSHLAINVSARQFNNDDLIDSVRRIIRYRSINPEYLQVEITENSFLDDPEEAAKKITKLKDLGIRIAIDDFGTGFSSVNYLRKLPVDVVKIDRSFIADITTSQQDRSIVKALIAMSAELGMVNVVEGVETMEQMELLMKFGIRRFQGYLFSKALPPEGYIEFYNRKLGRT